MADEKISALPPLTGAVATLDVLPVVDASASETKKISAKHLVQSALAIVDDDSIPLGKVDTTDLTLELPDKSVTAVKLAPNSSGIYGILPLSGEFQGQVAVDTGTKLAYMWSGSAWERTSSVVSVAAVGISPLQATGSLATDGTLSVTVGFESTTAARQFIAGPTGSAGNVEARQIIGADLPPATGGSIGAVSPGSGLEVSGTGSLSISNAVTPSDVLHLVTYDANGLVLSGREIQGIDIPIATELDPGVVKPGPGLSMGVDGALGITNSITPATGTKFTVDAQGSVVDVLVLNETDIPNISADKITSGELTPGVLADRSIEEIKLADYSTCFVQEGNPGGGAKLGQFWFTPSTNQLRVFGRGSGEDLWLSVGFGALQAQNLRWAGTINADTSTIVSLTAIGVSEGLVAGGPIPVPSDPLSGVYFVTQVEGSNISQPNVQTDTFTEGDWLLCIDAAQGYTHVDVSAGGGGGGGGGARYLDDLLDVEIGGLTTLFGLPRAPLLNGQFLMYDSISGMWVNSSIVDGGTY